MVGSPSTPTTTPIQESLTTVLKGRSVVTELRSNLNFLLSNLVKFFYPIVIVPGTILNILHKINFELRCFVYSFWLSRRKVENLVCALPGASKTHMYLRGHEFARRTQPSRILAAYLPLGLIHLFAVWGSVASSAALGSLPH